MIIADGKNRGQDHLNLMGGRQVGDHRVIVFNRSDWNPASQVVGACQDEYSVRMKIDHVGLHAPEHLARDLAGNAAIHEIAVRKVLVQPPQIGDRISEEYYSRLGRIWRGKSSIRLGVAFQVVPVRRAKLRIFLVEKSAKMGVETQRFIAKLGELLP